MVKSGKRVHEYSKETREYWERRNFVKALSKVYSDKIARMYRKQKGKCEFCGELPDLFIQSVGVSAVRKDEKTRSRIVREEVQKK